MALKVLGRLASRSLLGPQLCKVSQYSPPASVLVIKLNANYCVTSGKRYGQGKEPHFRHNYRLLQPFPSPIDQQQYFKSTKRDKCDNDDEEEKEVAKLSLFQRFKQMYKEYWYVLIPVHVVTSTVWFGGFYYLAKSGVDIVGILESMSISERILNPLRNSSVGYLAVAYACYKISTPLRYTVTLGGTTISINYLKKWGYIKPVPSSNKLKELYREQKDNLMESMRETREGLKIQSEKLKDKKEQVVEDLDKGLKQIKDFSQQIKSKKDQLVEDMKKEIRQKTKH